MDSCVQKFEQWQAVQDALEELEDACHAYQASWYGDFQNALANINQPEVFLKSMVKCLKGFETFAALQLERDRLLATDWIEALDDFWECIAEHAHH